MSDLREQKELIISENNKATQQLPAKIDMIESPDLEWQRFVESLSPEDKSKASGIFSESMIAYNDLKIDIKVEARKYGTGGTSDWVSATVTGLHPGTNLALVRFDDDTESVYRSMGELRPKPEEGTR